MESILLYWSRERNSYDVLLWVVIVVYILSKASLFFFYISLEFIRGFYWLESRVDLPVLQTE